MSTTVTATAPESYKLELMSAYGTVFRDVLRTPPRDCNASEVPVIDLSNIRGTESERKALAAIIRDAAENTGFFYVKNHGIPKATIDAAYKQAQTFFSQPDEKKALISQKNSKFFNGWTAKRAAQISPTETKDHREGFSFRYDPRHDPETKDPDAVPEAVKPWMKHEDFVWEGTSHLPGFKDDMVTYWQSCITLARSLIRIFALALDVPENYFDDIITYPGSDSVVNYYPKNTEAQDTVIDVGLGAHTDLQCFTLLWQDAVGGLQVLTKDGQWIKVPPVPDTFVINIGDFFQRLSNDRFQSTVHRVFNYAPEDRYSMPFFFGFNHNEQCSVLPTCTDEKNPPKYEPISCGEWCRQRFQKTFEYSKSKSELTK
ncbi:2OG-Fe(II) oxygenase superfamily protein [Colletotrichum sublineola]|uniref:Putative 2OG-Fe(II)oxygenase superfamily protein n=1 Tax=Colletotrichum sublineola TaxID=1173701 RepID=A0A066XPZ8_COLSU|nr:2OG-Fe(II) oxygenase superfamily protein [Colletotrichum sublineola]KDN67821.1 putative 2OG-Fe(II)oxygenase superfamily protein [Colletotrichum sublineola]